MKQQTHVPTRPFYIIKEKSEKTPPQHTQYTLRDLSLEIKSSMTASLQLLSTGLTCKKLKLENAVQQKCVCFADSVFFLAHFSL
jgi:hypothetical protein